MKRTLPIRWRLTLITAVLVAVACLALTALLRSSAFSQMDEMEQSILEIRGTDGAPLSISLELGDVFPGLEEKLASSRDAFQFQSIAALLAVVLASSACTYYVAGRALLPVRRLGSRMDALQAGDLSQRLELPASDDEIARLSRSFNQMMERLDRAFSVQKQFSANAAHELRTPLAVIQARLELLDKYGQPTAEQYEDACRSVREQTKRLSHLVEVLLEMTDLQTVSRDDTVSLGALIEEVLCDLGGVAEEKQVSLLQEGESVTLTGSDLLLYRAVYNLTENAVKYNRPGGSVTVSCSRQGGDALVRVADTGIGVRPEDFQRIFDPFFRADKSRSRAMGGAGLGLALVRDIAALHGGSVRVAKSGPEGTVMELALPLS
ncbi:MAG: ATP-binding protein [Eubacteriales bacterium]|nr:ATP-binding protein [Eubacteriales bacterium]